MIVVSEVLCQNDKFKPTVELDMTYRHSVGMSDKIFISIYQEHNNDLICLYCTVRDGFLFSAVHVNS